MFASFLDEIEKLSGVRNYGGDSRGNHFSDDAIQGMKEFLARPEVKKRIGKRRKSALKRALESAMSSVRGKAPAPKAAVKAEASSGNKALSALFKIIGENKKLFGTVGGVAVATGAAAALSKIMRHKSKAPSVATPTNA